MGRRIKTSASPVSQPNHSIAAVLGAAIGLPFRVLLLAALSFLLLRERRRIVVAEQQVAQYSAAGEHTQVRLLDNAALIEMPAGRVFELPGYRIEVEIQGTPLRG